MGWQDERESSTGQTDESFSIRMFLVAREEGRDRETNIYTEKVYKKIMTFYMAIGLFVLMLVTNQKNAIISSIVFQDVRNTVND
jgi:uncharacterized membrane protein